MVPGATRRIGSAVTERLRDMGWTVSGGVRDPSHLPCRPALSGHVLVAGRQGSAEGWVAAALARHARIEAVVNTAVINPRALMLDADESAFDAMWNVDAKGPMRVIRAAWPHLVAAGAGRVASISPLSGKRVPNENLG